MRNAVVALTAVLVLLALVRLPGLVERYVPRAYASDALPGVAAARVVESGTFMRLQNARDDDDFRPYAANSMWNRRVSAHPTFLPNSAAIVAAQFPGGQNPTPVRSTEAGRYDYGHPLFFATAKDPLVRLECTQYCNAPDNGGVPKTMRIPARARPAGGTDAHISVVQPDGTEIDAWAVYGSPGSDRAWNAPHDAQQRDWQTGDVLSAANIANCGPFASGPGRMSVGPGSTAADFCLGGGVVTASELAAGRIEHALFVGGQCAVGAQYPAAPDANTQQCTSGVGPPLGGREWYDVPCAQTRASSTLHPWEKAILCALNEYGGYFGDNASGGAHFTGGVAPLFASEEPWRDYDGPAYRSPFAALSAQGWLAVKLPDAVRDAPGIRWIGADPWHPAGVDFAKHIHWLAPCSARGTC